MINVSNYTDEKTANTCLICGKQRAENLALLEVTSVIELCVGPSLAVLEQVYKSVGIFYVAGNDIDSRWRNYYPNGKWIIGDARHIEANILNEFDAAVVAPPLSRGCSGKREDSLNLKEVQPSFESFLGLQNKVKVFVLPGRTLSISKDRSDLHTFLYKIREKFPLKSVDVVPLKNKVTKYVDVYVY